MIDIIIPTFGRHTRLYRTLSALDHCEDKDQIDTILVVENGEPYDAISICEQFRHLNICHIHETKKGAVQARNTGIKRSSATHILFLDDDIELSKKTISAYIRSIKKPD